MTRYSVQQRDWIFVKSYEFLSFARNTRKMTGENIMKNLSKKYSQKILYHPKQSANLLHIHLKLIQKE